MPRKPALTDKRLKIWLAPEDRKKLEELQRASRQPSLAATVRDLIRKAPKPSPF